VTPLLQMLQERSVMKSKPLRTVSFCKS
jgi:hypothetical protein